MSIHLSANRKKMNTVALEELLLERFMWSLICTLDKKILFHLTLEVCLQSEVGKFSTNKQVFTVNFDSTSIPILFCHQRKAEQHF